MNLKKPGRCAGFIAALLGAAYAGGYWIVVRPIYDIDLNLLGKPRADNSKRAKSLLETKRVIFVGAHPDDIEWWSGATVKMLTERGASVRLLVATRGDKSLPLIGWLRQRAQMVSARHLGADVVFLQFKDRKLTQNQPKLQAAIRKELQAFRPDLVIGWDPEFITNNHPDHVAVAKAGSQAARGYQQAYYGTRSPNIWVPFDDTIREAKWAALSSHTTEYPLLLWQRTKAFQTVLFRALGQQIGVKNAEPFRLSRADATSLHNVGQIWN